MKSSDVPHLKENLVADSAKKTEAKTDAKAESKSAPPAELADGASSHDAGVQQLLADRYIASLNDDKEAADAATAKLHELGFK